ncbi:DUF664 domain-containing protein, partial [Pseudonocardia sp. KRD291]|uniref:mycothiol transferase n=1 Tax=Pseudonocardia sp. KRD291 TaxID=2792007 RepID=UPI001C4A33DF
MNAPATSPSAGNELTGERAELVTMLERHRGFLLHTAVGLTDEQARTAGTVSALTIASLLKHVADTEEQWMDFAVRGAEAFGSDDEVYGDVDWDAVDATAQDAGGEWEDTRFALSDAETLDVLRARVEQVAARTEEILRSADLDSAHDLPVAPWFEPGARWSVRRVAMHMLAEISQH